MSAFRKGCAILAAMSMVLWICSCGAKKDDLHPGGYIGDSASSVKDTGDTRDASGPSLEHAAGNPLRHEVFLTQIHDAAIVGSDLLIVGKARVLSEVGGERSQENVAVRMKLPFEERCFALIKDGIPPGKEYRIVGKGWHELKPITDSEHMMTVTLKDILSCELTTRP